uniref:SPOR domain-containing protein n=1 Tax=Castellaniella defragrans TaxID=75697 RepID=UPI00333F8C4D
MFFRKATDPASERRTSVRGAGSSEAQLKELRNKARRRLIGALALVLAAVIIVPPLFDAPPQPESREPIVVPATSSGLVSALDPEPTADAARSVDEGAQTPLAQTAEAQTPAGPAAPEPAEPAVSVEPGATQLAAAPPPEAPKPVETPSRPRSEPAPEARPPVTQTKPDPIGERTDDGSVALALLAGKTPETSARPAAQPKAQGSFVLQVAAYTTEQDARQRRDSLVESGVTNAYVERGQSGDKTVYRLRVGPFPTHEAAQAAQTRLRALGYQNGMISGK